MARAISNEVSPSIGIGFARWEGAEVAWTLLYDEVIFVIEGCFELQVNGELYRVEPGQLLWIPEGTELVYGGSSVPAAGAAVAGHCLVSGVVNGGFYGLASIYAARQGLGTVEIGQFMALSIAAGLGAQLPLGWLSDRLPRASLIRCVAVLLMFAWLLLFGGCIGFLQFCLYHWPVEWRWFQPSGPPRCHRAAPCHRSLIAGFDARQQTAAESSCQTLLVRKAPV